MRPRTLALTLIAAYLAVGVSYLWSAPVVVLPERFKSSQVVVKNSAAWKTLEAKYKKQLAKENSDWTWYSKRVEEQLQAQDAELQKLRAQAADGHKGIWGAVIGVLNIGVMFFTNPFGYLMKTLIGVVEAIVVFILLIGAAKIGWRIYKKHKTPKQ